MRLILRLIATTFLLLAGGEQSLADKRVALVIGNGAYQHVAPLRNPSQDAAAVASLLTKLDFEVLTLTDLDKIGMEKAVRQFAGMSEGADVALFYYSGHAFQADDRNFLVPTSALIAGTAGQTLDMLALQDVSATMRASQARKQILILDACRDNPFGLTASNRPTVFSATRGLARIDLTANALLAYSTSPGQIAYDGDGTLSPFTQAFVHYAGVPNLEIRQVLSRVRSEVSSGSDGRQLPWDDSSLDGDVFLVPHRNPPVFKPLQLVVIAASVGLQPLRLEAPVQAEGGAVRIVIKQGPENGRLALDGRAIKDDESLASSALPRLQYARSAADVTNDAFSMSIEDEWGNKELGLVSIATGQPAQAQSSSPRPIGETHLDAVSLLGVGPNLIFKSSVPPQPGLEQTRVQLASAVDEGQLSLGNRVIEPGRSLRLDEISRLKFTPPPRGANTHIDAVFSPVDLVGGEVHLGIQVAISDCDRLAGDVLDTQGVTEGVLTEQMDKGSALPACETAVRAKPDVGRFHYELGRVLGASGRSDEALGQFHRAADLGYVLALTRLGYLHLCCAPTNYEQARKELETAISRGDNRAINTLAYVYYRGLGVPKDLHRAKALFEAAARMGNTGSMDALAGIYKNGEGVPADPAVSFRFSEEASKRGDAYGLNNLGFAYLDGTGTAKDPAKALGLFKQASDLGHPAAPTSVGRLYVLGLGVPVDLDEAARWYRLGSQRGDAWASYNLGELSRLGKLGAVQSGMTAYYYALAASSLNSDEVPGLAREQLQQIDVEEKLSALRKLLSDNNVPVTDARDQTALIRAATQAALAKSLTVADTKLDTALIVSGLIDWIRRNGRVDMY